MATLKDQSALEDSPRMERRLNVRALIISCVLLATLIPAIYVWHRYQRSRVADAMLTRAGQLEQAGDHEKAAEYLFRCFQLSQGDATKERDILVRLAWSYDQTIESFSDRMTAISWFQRAVGRSPTDLELRTRLAELYLETGQYRLALQHATDLEPKVTSTQVHRIRPLAHFRQLRRGVGVVKSSEQVRPLVPQNVLRELTGVLEDAPDDLEVAMAAADIYRNDIPQTPDVDPAAAADKIVDALVAGAPNDYRVYLARHEYRRLYGIRSNSADVNRAVELAPTEPEVLFAVAEQAVRDGQLDRARRRYDDLIQHRPDQVRGYLGLAQVLSQQGHASEAVIKLQEGLRSAANGRHQLHVRLIEALLDAQRLDEAETRIVQLERQIEQLRATAGEDYREWLVMSRGLLRGRLAIGRRDYRSAIRDLKGVVNTGVGKHAAIPESTPSFMARVLIGQCQLGLQQWEAAAVSFQQALEQVPTSTSTRLAAAKAWAAAGRDHEAIQLCEQIAARTSAPASVWQMLAQLHLRQQLRLPPGRRNWERLEQVLQSASAALPDSWEIPLIRAHLVLVREGTMGAGKAMQILIGEENAHPESVALWSHLVFFYDRIGMSAEAARAMHRLEQLQPDEPRTRAWKVVHLSNQGKFDEAQRLLTQTQSVNSSHDADSMWMDRAALSLAVARGDLTEVERLLLQIHHRRPQSTEVLIQLADLTLHRQSWDDCRRWVRALKETEGDEGVWWRFFQARCDLSDPSRGAQGRRDAEQLHSELRRRRPWWPGTVLLAGLLAEARGESDVAAGHFVKAIQSGFTRPLAYEKLVRALCSAGRFDEAAQWLTQLQQQQPLDEQVMGLAWSAALQRSQSKWAQRLAQDHLQQKPNDPLAHVWLAQILAANGRAGEARELAERAVNLQPQRAKDWIGILSVYVQLGDAAAAQQCLKQLEGDATLTPSQWHAIAGQALQQLRQVEPARIHLKHATKLMPQNSDLKVRYAAFERPYDPQRAEQMVREVLAVNPSHDGARRILASWLHGSDRPEAQQEATDLLRLTAGGSALKSNADRRLEAALLLRRGRPEDLRDALRILEELIVADPNAPPEDRLLSAMLYERTGDLTAAREQLDALASRNPPAARHLAALADFLLRHRNATAAKQAIERLEHQAPMSLSAVQLRSRWLFQHGQEDQIDPYLESYARKRLPDMTDDTQRQQFIQQVALLFASVDQSAGAQRWLDRLVQEYPDQRHVAAQFWLDQGQLPQAAQFAFDVSQPPSDPDSLALLARTVVQTRAQKAEWAKIDERLSDAVDKFPEHAELLFATASFKLVRNDAAGAIDILKELTNHHPEHVTAWNNLAALLADDSDRLSEALTYADRGLAAAGRPIAMLLDTKAVILLRMHEEERAAELLRQALAMPDGNDPRFFLHYAITRSRMDDLASARQAWQRAHELGLADSYLTDFEQDLIRELNTALAVPQSSPQKEVSRP